MMEGHKWALELMIDVRKRERAGSIFSFTYGPPGREHNNLDWCKLQNMYPYRHLNFLMGMRLLLKIIFFPFPVDDRLFCAATWYAKNVFERNDISVCLDSLVGCWSFCCKVVSNLLSSFYLCSACLEWLNDECQFQPSQETIGKGHWQEQVSWFWSRLLISWSSLWTDHELETQIRNLASCHCVYGFCMSLLRVSLMSSVKWFDCFIWGKSWSQCNSRLPDTTETGMNWPSHGWVMPSQGHLGAHQDLILWFHGIPGIWLAHDKVDDINILITNDGPTQIKSGRWEIDINTLITNNGDGPNSNKVKAAVYC